MVRLEGRASIVPCLLRGSMFAFDLLSPWHTGAMVNLRGLRIWGLRRLEHQLDPSSRSITVYNYIIWDCLKIADPLPPPNGEFLVVSV